MSRDIIVTADAGRLSSAAMAEAVLVIETTGDAFRVVKNRYGAAGATLPIETLPQYIDGYRDGRRSAMEKGVKAMEQLTENTQAKPDNLGWISVDERKPKMGKKVIVCGEYQNGNRWRTVAAFYPKGTLDASNWDDPPEDWWDENECNCTNPEDGWMEIGVESETMWALERVTHWMPLPEMPSK